MATKQITDASGDADVTNATGPVLVDFWAEWCGPCKMIGPSLEEISEELGEQVTIAKLNIEENPDKPSQLGIRGIPTLYIYKDGEKVAEQIGIGAISTKSKLKAWIEGELGAAAGEAG